MKSLIKILTISVAAIFSAGFTSAYGSGLTNNDTITYQVEIIEDQDPATTHELEMYEGDVIFDYCEQGCLVRFNGREYRFAGNEEMVIENGELIVTP